MIPKLRFGRKEADDDSRTYVVAKKEKILLKLLAKEKIEFEDKDSYHVVVNFLDDNGKMIEGKKYEFFVPKILETLLGWSKGNFFETIADVEKNCFIAFTYLGKSKSCAYLFDKEKFRIGFEKNN
jgi:hypothetical protein